MIDGSDKVYSLLRFGGGGVGGGGVVESFERLLTNST